MNPRASLTWTVFMLFLLTTQIQDSECLSLKLKKLLKKVILLKALTGKKGITIIPIPIPLDLLKKDKMEDMMDMGDMMKMGDMSKMAGMMKMSDMMKMNDMMKMEPLPMQMSMMQQPIYMPAERFMGGYDMMMIPREHDIFPIRGEMVVSPRNVMPMMPARDMAAPQEMMTYRDRRPSRDMMASQSQDGMDTMHKGNHGMMMTGHD